MSCWGCQTLFRRLPRQLNGSSKVFKRTLGVSQSHRQAEIVQQPAAVKARTTRITTHLTDKLPKSKPNSGTIRHLRLPYVEDTNLVQINVNGQSHGLSPVLLRDLCSCSQCIDPSTKQKLFATADIPSNIKASSSVFSPESTSVQWVNDIHGYGGDHITQIPTSLLDQLLTYGEIAPRPTHLSRSLWDAHIYERQTRDIDYEAYMNDDYVLLKALQQLHTHGLLFVTNVPESETSVETIGERIGPLKTTFYGKTWDVRSVPEAINVAYTAQNLGFHMDLMYMKQPPHVQLLHCIRSSAKGGASLFSDSFNAAAQLGANDIEAWKILSRFTVDYHYDHPGSQYYHQSRPVIEQESKAVGTKTIECWEHYCDQSRFSQNIWFPRLTPADFINHISWSPPFQAPFGLNAFRAASPTNNSAQMAVAMNRKFMRWLPAAKKFNELIHQPDAIYERLMKPGECVIFDNRRVLHARRAFEVGDAGTERWLRGAYLDKDPYMSKLKILSDQHDAPS